MSGAFICSARADKAGEDLKLKQQAACQHKYTQQSIGELSLAFPHIHLTLDSARQRAESAGLKAYHQFSKAQISQSVMRRAPNPQPHMMRARAGTDDGKAADCTAHVNNVSGVSTWRLLVLVLGQLAPGK